MIVSNIGEELTMIDKGNLTTETLVKCIGVVKPMAS